VVELADEHPASSVAARVAQTVADIDMASRNTWKGVQTRT